jgi:hypothetical protein
MTKSNTFILSVTLIAGLLAVSLSLAEAWAGIYNVGL